MNRNQQENRPAPGSGKPKNPRDVPSQIERQAQRERREHPATQDDAARADQPGTGGGDGRVRQQANADTRDPRSEQASARFDDARSGANPARESEGTNQHPRRDFPGTD